MDDYFTPIERTVHEGIFALRAIEVLRVACAKCDRVGRYHVAKLIERYYLVRTLGLVAVALVMVVLAGLLAFIAWWLRTWRNERLRPALISLTQLTPWFAVMVVGFGLSKYLEEHLKWPSFLASR